MVFRQSLTATVLRCLPSFSIFAVFFKLHFGLSSRSRHSSFSRTFTTTFIYIFTSSSTSPPSLVHLSPFALLHPFSAFRFTSYVYFIPRFPPPLPRQLSVATLVVDINKHLDYTVKAASTTSPGWKLEDSPIGGTTATERFRYSFPLLLTCSHELVLPFSLLGPFLFTRRYPTQPS